MRLHLTRGSGLIAGIIHTALISAVFGAYANIREILPPLFIIGLSSCSIGFWLGIYAERLKDASSKDFLTGLYNRRFFSRQFDICAKRCVKESLPISLALVDIDNFKQHNDTHGHDAGDAVLMQVSNVIKSGSSDLIVCRWGGEEFVILFPGLSGSQARRICDNIRSRVADLGITVSAGIASYKGSSPSLCDLVKKADLALYSSKTQRNTTTEYRTRFQKTHTK